MTRRLVNALDAAEDRAFEAAFIAWADGPPITLVLSRAEAFVLLGQVQLASRHKLNRGTGPRMARDVMDRLQALMQLDGALTVLADRGWDPAYDDPVPDASP